MSGFEVRWLDLREGADHAARNAELREEAAHYLNATRDAQVIDLGCGTGSTFRAMLPDGAAWHWRLLDNDLELLAEAMERHGSSGRIDCAKVDLAKLDQGLFCGSRMVTASALFDLVSEAFLGRLVSTLAAEGSALYSALNYDGHCEWDAPLPMDQVIVAAFNAHQRRDKGFGAALGPSAGQILQAMCEETDFGVFTAASPWMLGPSHAELQRELIDGIARAAGETGIIESDMIEDWRQTRITLIDNTSCKIGHWDLLALPK